MNNRPYSNFENGETFLKLHLSHKADTATLGLSSNRVIESV